MAKTVGTQAIRGTDKEITPGSPFLLAPHNNHRRADSYKTPKTLRLREKHHKSALLSNLSPIPSPPKPPPSPPAAGPRHVDREAIPAPVHPTSSGFAQLTAFHYQAAPCAGPRPARGFFMFARRARLEPAFRGTGGNVSCEPAATFPTPRPRGPPHPRNRPPPPA